ncbi:MAG: heterodisulfide reductase-related iron-sulfur binding cluster [Pyrinomonadaceae bacterium]|nr:heterodisulfide reductase-related iron-sulfur binding cluster [Pyrinomonadaceae bacterium]
MATQLTTTLAAEEQKLLACVHCGLCLEACPTYVLTGDENDSPRGRIYLMRAVEENKLPADSATFKLHIDRCLGCRACEPVCPAGVQYGQLLEASRAELFGPDKQRGFTYRCLRLVLRRVWLHPARLRFAFAVARMFRDSGIARLLVRSKIPRLFSRRFEFALALLDSSSPVSFASDSDADSSKSGATEAEANAQSQASTMLFAGCVGEGLFSRVNKATARVLNVNGFGTSVPKGQVCCGALHAHAGDLDGARMLARCNIEAFDDSVNLPIITNAGGCGAMLATYGHLLSEDPLFAERARKFCSRVRDVSQQLEGVKLKEGSDRQSDTATYDASCHLLYGQHASEAPLKLLRAIPELRLIPLEGAERCCGAAGVYNLLEPHMSQGVLKEKLTHVRETGAAILTTGNPGCQMQIGAGAKLAGMTLRVCHPVELLDESYRRAGLYQEGGGVDH